MKDRWTNRSLSSDSLLLQRIDGKPGNYDVMWDTSMKVIRIKGFGQEWTIPLASAINAMSLLGGSEKSRDDLTQDEIRFLKSLSDARFAKDWTQYGSTNYYIQTKTDSTGFVRDILIRRKGSSDHVHVYVDTVSGNRGMVLTTNGKHYPLDYDSLDDLLNDVGSFC